MLSLIETFWLQTGPYLGCLTSGHPPNDVARVDIAAHTRLIEAIETRDPEAARAALVAEFSDFTDVFSSFAEQLGTGLG